MTQIQVVYAVKFKSSVNSPTQLLRLQSVVLDPAQLDFLGLTISSDSTVYNVGAQKYERTVIFNETPKFVAQFGTTTSGRTSAIKNMFSLVITKKTKVPCTEVITLL